MKNAVVFMAAVLLVNLYSVSTAMSDQKREQKLVDRMIMQVGGSYYTQRQWECYVMVKRSFMSDINPTDLRIEPLHWERELEAFRDEMILVEASKEMALSNRSLTPTASMIDAAEEVFKEKSRAEDAISDASRKSCPDKSTLREGLVLFVTVQSYLRQQSKYGQAVPSDKLASKNPEILRSDESWFQSLLKATPFRYYDGARDPKILAPLR